MKFNLESAGRYTIIAYQTSEITVLLGMEASSTEERPQPRKQILTRSFILAPDQLVCDWPVDSIEHLANEQLQPVLDLNPELVLIGSGAQLYLLDASGLTSYSTGLGSSSHRVQDSLRWLAQESGGAAFR